MPVLAECNVGNVCRSRRASNAAGEEQRANLSTPRLGHQTGRNQAPRRVEGGVGISGGDGAGEGKKGVEGGRRILSLFVVAALILFLLLHLFLLLAGEVSLLQAQTQPGWWSWHEGHCAHVALSGRRWARVRWAAEQLPDNISLICHHLFAVCS